MAWWARTISGLKMNQEFNECVACKSVSPHLLNDLLVDMLVEFRMQVTQPLPLESAAREIAPLQIRKISAEICQMVAAKTNAEEPLFSYEISAILERHLHSAAQPGVKLAIEKERESCAKVAENFGPSRPLSVNASHSILCRGRWEGEQAASKNIAAAIRERGNSESMQAEELVLYITANHIQANVPIPEVIWKLAQRVAKELSRFCIKHNAPMRLRPKHREEWPDEYVCDQCFPEPVAAQPEPGK
jgi:hypothetical protein